MTDQNIATILSEQGIIRVSSEMIQGLEVPAIQNKLTELQDYLSMLKRLDRPLRVQLNGEISNVKTSIEWYDGCLARAEYRSIWVREHSELGDKFSQRTFDTFDRDLCRIAYDNALYYAEHFEDIRNREKNGIVFYGSTGTGKTHLSAAIANHIIEKKHITVMFGAYVDLLDRIRSEFSDPKEHTKADMKSLPLLIIDDLGKEKSTSWSGQTLFEIINYRYEHRLPIVITTNLMPDKLISHYDQAVISRMAEMCKYVPMFGEDNRLMQ